MFPRAPECASTSTTFFELGRAASAKAMGDYRLILPPLPTGEQSENVLFLHCDPSGRPYGIEDVGDALTKIVDMSTVVGMGSIPI